MWCMVVELSTYTLRTSIKSRTIASDSLVEEIPLVPTLADPSLLSSRLRLVKDVVEVSKVFVGESTLCVPFVVAMVPSYLMGR